MTARTKPLSSTFALFASLGLGAAALAACETTPPPNDAHTAPTATAPATVLTSAPVAPPRGTDPGSVDEKAIDATVSPCDDFYEHACGAWLKATPIPAEEASWTKSFDIIQENNEKLLHEIAEQDAKAPPADQPYSKAIGDYYASCLDEEGIEKAGTAPMDPFLKAIDKVKDAKSLAVLLADLHKKGVNSFFDYDSGQDFKDATQVIGQLSQSGLGLPDRDYYLKDTPKMKSIREMYEGYVAKMLTLIGEKEADAKAHAKAVMAFETALARVSMLNEEMRDPQKIYHRLDREGVEKAAPGFPWAVYFKEMGTPDVKPINVAQPDFIKAVDLLMVASPSAECKDDKAKADNGKDKKGDKKGDEKKAEPAKDAAPSPLACPSQPKKFPAADIKAYLRYHVVRSFARYLPKRFVDADFELERALTGAEVLPPRWKRCVRAIDRAMGEAIAVPFVKKVLGEDGKKDVKQMVQAIELAMGDRLGAITWMDDATRAKAKEKLAAISNKIAYPDKFRNYDALAPKVKRGEALGNRLAAIEFEANRRLAKIGKPLDRTEWFFPPQIVNAAYDPSLNEMQFPAGILQSPFYSHSASASLNFGSIGSVIGHELTHGFDDEGSQFDAKGNLSMWWSPSVRKEFEQRASCVSNQFDGFVAVDDVHVKGNLTLGENIADLGGLRLAYAAWKKGANAPKPNQKYTDEQQFFYGYAQEWCTNMRPEMMRLLVQSNPHAPMKFRVNGPLSNMTEFRDAFQCKEGPMARKDRCEVW